MGTEGGMAGTQRPGTSELERYIERCRQRRRIPGLALGLVAGDRTVLARGFGFRDVAARAPATVHTIFGIASMTKSFVAMALLRLAEHGALRISDPVVRHLPGFRTPEPRRTAKITLAHLLSHSSGLPPLPSIYYTAARSLSRDPPYDPRVARRVGIDPDHPPIDTYEGLLDYLATARYRLLGPPGAQFSYSNEGYGLLGAVIERTSGERFERYLEEEVLRPAGMRHTMFDTGIMLREPEVTTLYSPNWHRPKGRLVASQEWWEDASLRAAGSLRTHVADLMRYVGIYLHGGRAGRERILSSASLEEMLRPRIEVAPGVAYGYGLAILPDYHGHLVAYHGGGLKGVASEFAVLPRDGIGGAVLANADGAPSHLALHAGINRLLGLPLATPFEEVPRGRRHPGPLGEYAGWYASGEGIWCRIRPQRAGLRLDFRGIEYIDQGLRLRPVGDDGFALRKGGESRYFRFLRDERGKVRSVHLGWRWVRRRSVPELRRARTGGIVW